jgi:hypothetical protein
MKKDQNHESGVLATLTAPESSFPALFYSRIQRVNNMPGEYQLLAALLLDGVRRFQKYLLGRTSRQKRLFQEAEEWICDTDTEYVFAFENVCEVLDIDPTRLRQGLLHWKQEQLARLQM